MIVSQERAIQDSVFSVTLLTESTVGEQELFEKYGEPLVNIGGDFTGPPMFTLADAFRQVDSAFPYTFSLALEDDSQAQDKCTVWANAVTARITTEMNIVRGFTDSFTGETRTTI